MYIGILEDDPVQQELYRGWFRTDQHRCNVYGAAAPFIEALPKEKFDLLLIDWMLPESSGEAVLDWVREPGNRPPAGAESDPAGLGLDDIERELRALGS